MNTFKKEERLKSKKQIEALFEGGKSVDAFPLKAVWIKTNPQFPFPAQAGFSVSKKYFPKAVDRNRVKRLMREAYRLRKTQLYEILAQKNTGLSLMLLYVGRKQIDFIETDRKVEIIFNKLKDLL